MNYVALLRAVNVGGKNKLPMKGLCEIFTAAGCDAACHYIQSGNVVFRAPAKLAGRLPERLSDAIQKQYGHRPPVLLRTLEEFRAVVANNPFPVTDVLHVVFLADAGDAFKLDPERSPGDKFEVRGREIYLNVGNGMGTTKLTNAYFDSKLKTISTARNWRTVLKLLEMLEAL